MMFLQLKQNAKVLDWLVSHLRGESPKDLELSNVDVRRDEGNPVQIIENTTQCEGSWIYGLKAWLQRKENDSEASERKTESKREREGERARRKERERKRERER